MSEKQDAIRRRRLDVLELVEQGLDRAAIADVLGCSLSTVDHDITALHRSNAGIGYVRPGPKPGNRRLPTPEPEPYFGRRRLGESPHRCTWCGRFLCAEQFMLCVDCLAWYQLASVGMPAREKEFERSGRREEVDLCGREQIRGSTLS